MAANPFRQQPDPPRLRSVLQAARYLGISRNSCWALVRSGEIPHVKILSRVLIDGNDLAAFIQAHKSTTGEGAR